MYLGFYEDCAAWKVLVDKIENCAHLLQEYVFNLITGLKIEIHFFFIYIIYFVFLQSNKKIFISFKQSYFKILKFT